MQVGVHVFFPLQLNIHGLKLEIRSSLLQSIDQQLPTTADQTIIFLPSNDPTIRRVIGMVSVRGREKKSSVSCMPTVQFHFPPSYLVQF